MTPPAALMSSTACSAPFLSWAPKAAFGPVIGPATPILICALRRARESNTETERDAGQQHFLHLVTPLEIFGFLTPATAGHPADRRNLAFFAAKVTPVLQSGFSRQVSGPARS